jgi:hypothetical protein
MGRKRAKSSSGVGVGRCLKRRVGAKQSREKVSESRDAGICSSEKLAPSAPKKYILLEDVYVYAY